jgi:hypothetical protein
MPPPAPVEGLADGEVARRKTLLPGLVSHATNVAEQPELVVERIIRSADFIGRERVIPSTDCTLCGRVHRRIAWAKLVLSYRGPRTPAANSGAQEKPDAVQHRSHPYHACWFTAAPTGPQGHGPRQGER